MRLSLVSLAVFAAPSLVHGRRHRCSRSTPLSSAAAATPDTSSGWTSTPSASVSPSSVIIASSSTPILSDSSAVSPSASTPTPGSDVPTTFSIGTTPAGTPSSSDVSVTPSSTDISATPSSTDISTTPSSSLSSTSLEVSSSASETPIASTTPAESTTLITQTTPSASTVSSVSMTLASSTVISSSSSSSAPAATPTGWQLQSSGANSAYAGSFMLGYTQYKDGPHLLDPSTTTPDVYSKMELYIEPGTGYLFWIIDGVNNRYQFYTTYDEFNENGEYYYNVNPGLIAVYDRTDLSGRHVQPLVCSRTAASFSCSANTPAGVFSHFMVNPASNYYDSSIAFGSSVPSPYQEVTFAAVDVY
ncbi:unnamed protein product [Clonostachys byssicola]|uniref:Uncharacterized protein n=1 Tax=Clonostachys byssicola TaxID=160290 RepID=A0A9N9YA32_9HYPO|nr:unnamed protein product [Clonostachys byssicola]